MSPPFCVRLKSFYQKEWDKVHQIYQEEADKCCMLMEEQVGTHAQTHTHTCTYVNVTERCVVQLTDPIDAPSGGAAEEATAGREG